VENMLNFYVLELDQFGLVFSLLILRLCFLPVFIVRLAVIVTT